MADREEIKGLAKKILNKVTTNQARVFSVCVTLVILLLFLATNTGRHVIVFLAYVLFVAACLFGGFKLYKYTTENAHGTPKEKKAKEEIEIHQDPFEDSQVEVEPDPFVNEGSDTTDSTTEEKE